jgi:four helix bundle protein
VEKPHKRLVVWQESVSLVGEVYRMTKRFPAQELYGLTSQLRRAAISIPSNIAEGAARNTKRDFANFLHNAQGSLSELDTQLDIAQTLAYLSSSERDLIDQRLVAIDRMLTGLIKSVKRSSDS